MYLLYFEKHFVASAKKLERKIKEKLAFHFKILKENPTHPHLHLKPLHGPLSGFYAIRFKEYRIIIEFLKNKKIRILEIDRRDKIYKT